MKVVTAAAALDSGEFEPDTVLNADSPKEISGRRPRRTRAAQSFGDIDMTTALTNSVNTYWAQVGEQLGTETMVEYMERFGFYADPELDYPTDQMAASGVYNSDGDLVEDGFDVGRVAIGQGGEEGQLLATATQMAEVAATVANGGTLMKPTFLQEAKDPDGRTIEELDDGEEQDEVISEETAAQLTEMMTNVTEEGTAAASASTGSSSPARPAPRRSTSRSINQPWFIGFAPAEDPQIAVAATVERCTGCFGGETAGPIATAVMESLLDWMRLEEGQRVDDRYTLVAPARQRRDGRRLARRRRDARPPGRAQVPARALRPGRRSSSSASAARRRPPPASSTRTWSASTTAARPTAATGSRWSTSRARRSRT